MVNNKKERPRRRPISFLDVCTLDGDIELLEKVEDAVQTVDEFTKSNLLVILKALYGSGVYHTNQEIMDTYGISREALDDFIRDANDYAECLYNRKNA